MKRTIFITVSLFVLSAIPAYALRQDLKPAMVIDLGIPAPADSGGGIIVADVNNDGRGDIFDLLEMLRRISQASATVSDQPQARMTALGPCQGEGVRSAKGTALSLRQVNDIVEFTHSGASYNCCMDSIAVSLEYKGGIVRIIETEYAAVPCRCVCDYTVFGEITGLS